MTENIEIIILVTGLLRSGKSTLINAFLQDERIPINHSLAMNTSCHITPVSVEKKECFITLVEIPGFNNENSLSDSKSLMETVEWLHNKFSTSKSRVALGGIIYVHDISESRYATISRPDLLALERSFIHQETQAQIFSKFVFVTTKYAKCELISPDECMQRVEELKSRYWRIMIDQGAHLVQFKDITQTNAWEAIRILMESPIETSPQVIKERLDKFKKQYERQSKAWFVRKSLSTWLHLVRMMFEL